MIVYISGPITGFKNNNAEAFFKMEKTLKNKFADLPYLKIVNPQRLGKRVDTYFKDISKVLKKDKKPEWEDYMRLCIAELSYCSHVIVLDNYKKSKGVKVELFIARMLDIPVFFNLEELQKEFAM